jgi:glycosyltransferase involved in cell wall biosynthesis
MNEKIRICYVSCYKDPNYTRSNSLISALRTIDKVDLVVIRNKRKGLLRYLETPIKLLLARIRFRPETFIVGFRANEIFWAFYPAMIGKKIVFDEFINLHDWLVHEHKKLKKDGVIIKAIDMYMKAIMKKSHFILTDSEAHRSLCSENYSVSLKKIVAIPIGADEKLYHPRKQKSSSGKGLKVLFYGSMLPLHGVDVVLDSLSVLAERGKINGIHYTFAGGRNSKQFTAKLDRVRAIGLGGHVTDIPWVDSEKLPDFIGNFDVCLGGPFGNTGQARRVVTGKTYQLLCIAKATIIGRTEATNLFEDKNNCIMVKQGSSSALADAIEWSADHKEELLEIGKRGRELYEKEYSSKVIGDLLQRLVH